MPENDLNANKAEENKTVQQYIVFGVADKEFGVNVIESREIVTAEDLTTIPDSPSYVLGVINLREEIIPIIDLAERFHLEQLQDTEDSKIIIISVNETLLGLAVNRVDEIIRINKENISPPPEITQSLDRKYIKGIAQLEEKLLVLLDIEEIFSKQEIEEISNIGDN